MTRRNKTAGVSGSSRSSIDVLLTEDVGVLGKQGSIVRVKPGYARNFLVPQGLAAVATEHNKRMVDRHKLLVADLQVQRVKALRGQADAVSKYSVTLEANANKEGHLYGSIVALDINKSLEIGRIPGRDGPHQARRPAQRTRNVYRQGRAAFRREDRSEGVGRPRRQPRRAARRHRELKSTAS